MAHPYAAHKQSKVERSRVPHITRGYASGGAVRGKTTGVKAEREMASMERDVEGEKSKHRADRPNRAAGGRVKKGRNNSRTIVNVITGGDKAAPPPIPIGGIAGPAPAAPMPPPPMAMKPPMPPMAAPGGPPPMPLRAKGGRVNQGSKVFEASERAGTKVQHDVGKNDGKDIRTTKPITFKRGGRVISFNARTESPDGVAKATKLPGGAGGGEARLAQAHRASRK